MHVLSREDDDTRDGASESALSSSQTFELICHKLNPVLFIARGGDGIKLRCAWVIFRRAVLFLVCRISGIFFGGMPFSHAASAVFSSPAGLWVIDVVPAFSAAIAPESRIQGCIEAATSEACGIL